MRNNHYITYILDLLSPLGGIKVRKMFGGYGIYKDSVFFALIIDDTLYFKVGDNNRAAYQANDSKPFSYEKNNKTVSLSYWQVPADILEDSHRLVQWVNEAVKAAKQTRKKHIKSHSL